jgi:hypothetical protein
MKPRWMDAAGGMPVGLIGALALVLGVECFIASHKSDTMDGSLWTYEHVRGIAAEKAGECDLLVFGDSLMRHGVAPKVIEERTGLDGYNLAIAGSQVPASYFLFREAIDSGARPRAVLLDLFPCLLASDPWANITNWPIVASYRDCIDLGWYGRDAKLFTSLMLRKTLPSVRCRESIRAAIVEALDGLGGVTRTSIKVSLRNWEVNRGLAIEKNRHDPNVPLENPVGQFFRPISCTPLNRLYIDRFMKLAADHDVKVFLVLPPYMPILQARVEQVGFDADHEAFVRSMLDRYPALNVLDARKTNYAPDVFIDTHHLGYEGASTFSAEIGELLRRQLDRAGSADRWVSLPTFRKWAITVKHENCDESWLAYYQELEKRRR